MNYRIEQVNWAEQEAALRLIRTRVFIEEQSVPEALEWDDEDNLATHFLARDDQGKPIGTSRLLRDGHIGRMAVLSAYRRQGIGFALLNAALEQARQQQNFSAFLYAQTHAVSFYQRAGFIVHGEEFMDAGIPHLTMRLQLAETRLLGIHGGNFAPGSMASITTEIISQTEKKLRILSFDLDPTTFDQADIERHISALARKSRYSDVRLLIVDASKLISRGHRLLNLQRRLSSSIKIRRVRNEPHEIKENWILADQCGVVCQSIKEPDHLWANFNNRPVAQNYISQFDDLWERGIVDPDLRQLEI